MDHTEWKVFAEKLKRADADTIAKIESMIEKLLEQKEKEEKKKERKL